MTMRVTGGASAGRKLAAKPSAGLRPTTAMVRQAIFNTLGRSVQGAVVADIFAGAGTLGIEALSRGAQRAVFVERSRRCVSMIRGNLERAGQAARAQVYVGGASAWIRSQAESLAVFDILFLDPPYASGVLWLTLELLAPRVRQGCLAVAEHGTADGSPAVIAGWRLDKQRRYGGSVVSYLVAGER